MGVRVIEDFTKGKRTRRGEPIPGAPPPFVATVVTRDAIDSFLGTRNGRERRKHLRALRDLGLLVHDRDRLTQRVRLRDGRKVRAFVFRGPPADVPRRRSRVARRVTYW